MAKYLIRLRCDVSALDNTKIVEYRYIELEDPINYKMIMDTLDSEFTTYDWVFYKEIDNGNRC